MIGSFKRPETAIAMAESHSESVSPRLRPEPLGSNIIVSVCELESDESPLMQPSPLKPTMNSMVPRVGMRKQLISNKRRNFLNRGRMNHDLRSCTDLVDSTKLERRGMMLHPIRMQRAASPAPEKSDPTNHSTLSRNSDQSNNSRKVLLSKFRDTQVFVTTSAPSSAAPSSAATLSDHEEEPPTTITKIFDMQRSASC